MRTYRWLSPVSMSIVISWVLPISSLPQENTLGYLSHNSSKADLMVGLMLVSCRSTFLGPGTSAGDVRNALSMGTTGSLYLFFVGDVVSQPSYHFLDFIVVCKFMYFHFFSGGLCKTYNFVFT